MSNRICHAGGEGQPINPEWLMQSTQSPASASGRAGNEEKGLGCGVGGAWPPSPWDTLLQSHWGAQHMALALQPDSVHSFIHSTATCWVRPELVTAGQGVGQCWGRTNVQTGVHDLHGLHRIQYG